MDRERRKVSSMRGIGVRVTLVFALATGLAVGRPLPALAKGAVKAVITGPGISSPITLRESDDSTGLHLGAIAEESGFLTVAACGSCHARLRHPPTEQLGPRYTVTYTMMKLPGVGRSDEVVQYVYPLAVPQPVTYMPPGQRFWKQATVGGWFVGLGALRLELQEVGVPPTAAPTLSPASGSSGAIVSNDTGLWSMRMLLPLSVALVVIAILFAYLRRPLEAKKGATARGSTTP
jgi:hypothetical protein